MEESLKNTCLPGLFPLDCTDGTQELDVWLFLLGSEALTNGAARERLWQPWPWNHRYSTVWKGTPNQEKGWPESFLWQTSSSVNFGSWMAYRRASPLIPKGNLKRQKVLIGKKSTLWVFLKWWKFYYLQTHEQFLHEEAELLKHSNTWLSTWSCHR